MNNYKLLEQHRRKLSLYFALFILFSLWLVVWFFEASIYYKEKLNDKKSLENKVAQITNIIKNKDVYQEIEELTFKKVLNKIFQDSIIKDRDIIIYSKIEWFDEKTIPKGKEYIDFEWYKYHKKIIHENGTYTIIVRKPIRFNKENIYKK